MENTTELKVRPLYDKVLVRRLGEEEKTAGGLYIPDTAKEKPIKGEIVAAGKGKLTSEGTLLPLEVHVGDQVIFNKYAGTELKIQDQDYLMMREEDILGIIN